MTDARGVLDRSTLLHVAVLAEWEAASGDESYTPSGFAAEGFIHLCDADQLAGVLERYYAGRSDLVLVEIDAARLDAARLRYEPSPQTGEAFAHLYGPLPRAAVRGSAPVAGPAVA